MKDKVVMRLIVLFLGFSYVLSCAAVPATRILKSTMEIPLETQDFLAQDAMDLGGEELVGSEEAYIEGRMDMESTDYPGTGANNHHDPKTPGRA